MDLPTQRLGGASGNLWVADWRLCRPGEYVVNETGTLFTKAWDDFAGATVDAIPCKRGAGVMRSYFAVSSAGDLCSRDLIYCSLTVIHRVDDRCKAVETRDSPLFTPNDDRCH